MDSQSGLEPRVENQIRPFGRERISHTKRFTTSTIYQDVHISTLHRRSIIDHKRATVVAYLYSQPRMDINSKAHAMAFSDFAKRRKALRKRSSPFE